VVLFLPSAQQCTWNANPPFHTVACSSACPKTGPQAAPAPCPRQQVQGYQAAKWLVCSDGGKRQALLGARAMGCRKRIFHSLPWHCLFQGAFFFFKIALDAEEERDKMTCPGPTRKLCPSCPPASLASRATPKTDQRTICSVSVSLSQNNSISSSFSWDNFMLSSCFIN